jgi:hypothetical protein
MMISIRYLTLTCRRHRTPAGTPVRGSPAPALSLSATRHLRGLSPSIGRYTTPVPNPPPVRDPPPHWGAMESTTSTTITSSLNCLPT